jgi:hypothetical protein
MKGEKKGARAEKKGPALFSWTKGGPEKEGPPLSWTQRGQSPALRALPSFGPFSYPKNLFSSGFAIPALILFNEGKHPLINRINPINLLLIYDTILYIKEMYIL